MNNGGTDAILKCGRSRSSIGVLGLIVCADRMEAVAAAIFHLLSDGVLFWFGIAAGSLLWLMIHFLTGGKWGYPLRRFFEAAAGAFPLMLLLFFRSFLGCEIYIPG